MIGALAALAVVALLVLGGLLVLGMCRASSRADGVALAAAAPRRPVVRLPHQRPART